MKKTMTVSIASENTTNGDNYITNIDLPAKEYEIQDALERARITSQDMYREYTIIDCAILPTIEHKRLDAPTIEELNYLAKRLNSLEEFERIAYEAVATKNLVKDENEIISIKDLINYTYGLDDVMIGFGINTIQDVGQFVIDNELNRTFEDISSEVIPYLDMTKIGTMQAKIDGGIFIKGNYIITKDYDLKEIYDGKNLPIEEQEDNSPFRLEIVKPPENDKELEDVQDAFISLPIDIRKANEIAKAQGVEKIQDCVYLGFESTIPQIDRFSFSDMKDFDKLNILAKAITQMSPIDKIKFKAVLCAEKPDNINSIFGIAKNLVNYEIDTNIIDSTQFYRNYLSRHLDNGLDKSLLNEIRIDSAKNTLLERLGAKMTDYGIVSARGKGLYNNVSLNSAYEFALLNINGQNVIYTSRRLKENEVPQGLYKYELRGGNMYEFETIEKSVFVDYAGTILTKEPFDFGEKDYIELNEENYPDFSEEHITMDEFAKTDYDLKEQTMEGM